MSLTGVKISEEVWSTCLAHALSTETEEVMGLLLGDISEDKSDGSVTSLIWGAAPQARSDRRKDRVESTPEQLAAASAQAEIMTREIGRTTRVIGWYHSHPHITVHPSHVDVKTQGSYQLLDKGFVGIIFSCFNEDPVNKFRRIQVIAFQSVSKSEAGCRQSASAQEADAGFGSNSRTLMATMRLERQLEEPSSDHSGGGLLDENELVQLSPEIKEAMHLSSFDMSTGEFASKEIHVQVVPLQQFGLSKMPPDPFLELQRTLFEEEKCAFEQAVSQSKSGQYLHPLAALHHSAMYQASLSRLLEFCTLPAMASLWDKLYTNNQKLTSLQKEAFTLQTTSPIRDTTKVARSSHKNLSASKWKQHPHV